MPSRQPLCRQPRRTRRNAAFTRSGAHTDGVDGWVSLEVSPLLRELVVHLDVEPGAGPASERERRLGDLVLDDGAVRAVLERKASLLPAGITAVHGGFLAGEPVRLLDPSGSVVARGIVNYDAADLPSILGKSTHALVAERGPEFDREVVHRDALIVKLRRRSATG